jgi:hypothetical protein
MVILMCTIEMKGNMICKRTNCSAHVHIKQKDKISCGTPSEEDNKWVQGVKRDIHNFLFFPLYRDLIVKLILYIWPLAHCNTLLGISPSHRAY